MNWANSWPKNENEVGVDSIGLIRVSLVLEDKTNFFADGEVVGDLAVYKAKEGGWRVFHVPTATRIDKATPEGLHTKKALLNWCQKIQVACEYEFSMIRECGKDHYEEANIDFDLFKDKCLAIKVE